MSIVVRFTPQNVTTEQYDQSIARLNEQFDNQMPDGCLLHVAFTGSDGSLNVSEIWESEQKFQAFGETLMPILADLGINPGQPQILQVHNLEMR